MVKLTGPALSVAASGTLGDLLTFGHLRSTHTLRKRPRPTDPKSGGQLSMRAIMQFLTGQWSSLGAPNQATWADAPEKGSGSTYNAYLSHNLKRWRNLQGPTKAYPATPTGPIGTCQNIAPSVGPRHYTLNLHMAAPTPGIWYAAIIHDLTTWLPIDNNNVIKLLPLTPTGTHTWTHEPIATGLHYYTIYTGLDDGYIQDATPDFYQGNVP